MICTSVILVGFFFLQSSRNSACSVICTHKKERNLQLCVRKDYFPRIAKVEKNQEKNALGWPLTSRNTRLQINGNNLLGIHANATLLKFIRPAVIFFLQNRKTSTGYLFSQNSIKVSLFSLDWTGLLQLLRFLIVFI